MTDPDVNTHDTHPAVTTHALLGVAGGLTRPADVLIFAGFYQVTRLFGGEMGSTFMGHFIAVREEFHSTIAGLNVQLGNRLNNSRLLGLQHGFDPHSTGLTAMGRAAEVLWLKVRQQAYTLAISESFILLVTCCVACLVVVSFISKALTQYRRVTARQWRLNENSAP